MHRGVRLRAAGDHCVLHRCWGRRNGGGGVTAELCLGLVLGFCFCVPAVVFTLIRCAGDLVTQVTRVLETVKSARPFIAIHNKRNNILYDQNSPIQGY